MEFLSSIGPMILYAVRSCLPIALAAVGGAYCARTGTMALGMEGFMLIGSFFAVLGTSLTGTPVLGLLVGVLCAGAYAMLFGLLAIRFRVNQVMSGIALNMLAVGLTSSLTQIIWGTRMWSDTVTALPHIKLPVVGDLSLFVPLTIVVAVAGWYHMFKTPWGLRLRIVGENPIAATSLGIPVKKYRYFGCLMCGILCGFGGAYLSIDHVNRFARDMVAGRGYIAVAVNILGRFNPMGALGGSLLFGLADSVQTAVDTTVVPSQLMDMIPYVLTVLVVVFAVRYSAAPAGMNMTGESSD